MACDRQLAAGHEAAHRVLAQHLGADWSAAWLWRGPRRWDGLCKHAPVEHVSLVAAAGAVGEGLLHGYRNPVYWTPFLGAQDAAAVGTTSAEIEGALRFGRHILGGQRRAEWRADTALLGRDLRCGEWARSPRPPAEWIANSLPKAKDSSMQTDPEYKTDQDCFTKLNEFLQEHLPEDFQTEAQELIEQLITESKENGRPGLAADSKMLFRVRAKEKMMARDAAAFAARFPIAATARRRF